MVYQVITVKLDMNRRKRWNCIKLIFGALLFMFVLGAIKLKRLSGWGISGKNVTTFERGSVVRKLIQLSENQEEECHIPHLKKRLREPGFSTSSVSCRRLKPVKNSCRVANKIFQQHKMTGCQSEDEEPNNEFCKIKKHGQSYTVICHTSTCEKELLLGTIDTETGSLRWNKFTHKHDLETVIKETMRKPNSGFCYIKCRSNGSDYTDYDDVITSQYLYYMNYISPQILNLPPYIAPQETSTTKHTAKYINFNVIFLDSVSRHHFFRSLPKTVEYFERNQGDLNDSSKKKQFVLDFELVQGIRSRTYESLQAFFAGLVNPFEKPFSTLSMPPTPLKTEVILKPLKDLGYSTLWLEDLCYQWEWGISKDLLVHDKELTQEETWKKLQKALKKAGIDSLGNTYAQCEILKENGVNDHFHGPDKVCYHSKHQHQYSLEYLKMYQESMHSKRQPYFTFYETNIGHEDTGLRIQDFDTDFVQYLKFIKSQDNTMTIIFSDHGNAYGKFMEKSREARIELFHPLLFMMITKDIRSILSHSSLQSLIVNQDRLVSLLDLHYTITDIISILKTNRHSSKKHLQDFAVSDFNKQFNVTSKGLLSVISKSRACNQMPRINPNLCICEGHEITVTYSSYYFLLALYAVGELNNHLQRQRRLGLEDKTVGGFGNCQRLVLQGVDNIRESSQDGTKTVKMDLHIPSAADNKTEVFFVTLEIPADHHEQILLTKFERVTSYSQYGKCSDHGVELQLCVCDSRHSNRIQFVPQGRPHVYNGTTVQKSVIDVDGHNCLSIIAQSNEKGVIFEVFSSCKKRLSLEFVLETTNMILSADKDVSVEIFPGDVTFLNMAVVYNEKKNWSWAVKTGFKIL